MNDSYVSSQATLKCTFGDKTSKLNVSSSRTVFLTGKPMANISDHKPVVNISPFGKLTPMPCVPGTSFSEWQNGKDDYIVKGKPALLKSSICRCQWGGIISIINDGQVDTGPADLSKVSLEKF